MEDLFTTFSLEQIFVFTFILAAAIKGAVSWFDWAIEKIKTKSDRRHETEDVRKEIRTDIQELKDGQNKINESIEQLAKTVNLLMASDKDDIKAYITREHHYFCYTLGYIDDYNLDCLEKRYSYYKKEGGNSFVADLMGEIRTLPKKTIEVTPSEITSAIQKEKSE
jgi:hypothetical protein